MFFKYVAERVEKKILQWEKIDTRLASPNLKLMQIKMPTIFKTSSKKQKIKKPSKARTQILGACDQKLRNTGDICETNVINSYHLNICPYMKIRY